MPVAVRITPHNMSREEYDQAIVALEASGADQPEGRLFHAAYGDDEVHMFEARSLQAASVGPRGKPRAGYPSTFPGGPPREAISAEKLFPAALGTLSASSVSFHSPFFAA